jgi:hypothetical protein
MEMVDHPSKFKPAPEDPKLIEVWQEYLQKCCEIGQIEYQLEQLDTQKKQIEKNLEVTQRQRNNAANKHRDLLASKNSKLKIAEEPKIELNPETVTV